MVNPFSARTVTLVFITSVGITALIVLTSNSPVSRTPSPIPDEVRYDPRVIEVASHFWCPCGRCGEMELLECRCKARYGAVQTFTTIYEELQKGHDVPTVVETIARRFGGLKAEDRLPPPAGPTPPSDAAP